jgi:hypothetical protein
MIGWHERDILVFIPLAHFDRILTRFPQKASCGNPAQCANDFRSNNGNLPFQERQARFHFVLSRFTVFGWATLDDVTNIHVFAGQAHSVFDNFGQKPAGLSNERLSNAILIPPRTFTHEKKSGRFRAFSENQISPSFVEPASFAFSNMGFQVLKGHDGLWF